MEIHCLGVGEAFDPERGNTATIVRDQRTILVDCGYAIPALLFADYRDPNEVDAIYLTHFHADHVFGMPALLGRYHFDGRTKPLGIFGQPGTEQTVMNLMQLGYPGLATSLNFPIFFRESTTNICFQEFELDFAETKHPVTNYAVRFTVGETKVAISGDGALTDSSRELFQPCHALVHAALSIEKTAPGHASIRDLTHASATWEALQSLVIVHLGRDIDRNEAQTYLTNHVPTPITATVAEPGFRFSITSEPPNALR